MSTSVGHGLPLHTPVAVVGGGPVGLITSLLLSDLGVEHVLLERHAGTAIHPKAVGLNQRTVEILHALGLADEIAAAAAPQSTVSRTGWYTSLGGPTDLHGREIAVRDAWGGGAYEQEYADASAAPYTMLPQIRLEPILRRAAEARPQATVRFGAEVTSIVEGADGVEVAVSDGTGAHTLRADYVVGADGGRFVAGQLGIGFTGPTDLVDMVSAHFSADLTDHLPNRECLIYWLVNPDLGGSIGSGYLYHLGPWDEQGRSKEWVFACGFGPDDPDRFDEDAMRARIVRSLGVDDLEVDLHSTSHWYIQAVVADRFRTARCFLVGDAAHRIPPWGALGLNTGAQDAHNLAWKLAAVLRGDGDDALLDTYESERRTVAERVAASSLHNFANHGGMIDAAIGLAPDQDASEGWAALRSLWTPDDEAGRERRRRLEEAVAHMDLEFHAHGAENGFAYVAGALCPDPDAATLPDDTVVYRPTTRPGHHVPHAWLVRDGGERISSTALGRPGRLTLLVSAGHEARWAEAVRSGGHRWAGLVDVIAVAGPDAAGGSDRPAGSLRSEDGRWQRLREVGDDGAVLVRPDTIVAWRSHGMPDDAVAALHSALDGVAVAAPLTPRDASGEALARS